MKMREEKEIQGSRELRRMRGKQGRNLRKGEEKAEMILRAFRYLRMIPEE